MDYRVQEWHTLNLSFAKLRANFEADAAGRSRLLGLGGLRGWGGCCRLADRQAVRY
jgi:hypothetical protein